MTLMGNRSHRLGTSRVASRAPIVAVVVDVLFPYHLGGREVRYYELTKRLAKNASIHIYTMNWWHGPGIFTDGDVTIHAICRLHPLYAGGRRSLRQGLFFAFACLKLVRERFDVLDADHIPYLQILVLRVIASLRRKRFVVTWHEVWGKAYWCQYLGSAGRVAWFIEWLAMRLPDHIVAASPQTEQRLRAILGNSASITTAPNGVDFQAIRAASADEVGTDLVVVGRLIDHKRVDMLLEALAMLRSRGVVLTCRIIGDGPERDALHRQVQELGLSDAVAFRHDVREQKELYALVKAAKAAVFPSEREGFGAAVLEALACGVPVVTTSAPDNLAQDLAARSERGYVCEPTAVALADTLQSVLTQPKARADTADAWLADYTWDGVAGIVRRALAI
jgi:glycosyltransferase involved in cell wall biosynthesis